MIIYTLCFDLGVSQRKQIEQVSYWLNFLNSALPLPPHQPSTDSNMVIIPVGLRADLAQNLENCLQNSHLQVWKKKWNRLPLYNQLYHLSSFKLKEKLREFLQVVERVCENIFEVHSKEIPTIYKNLLHSIHQTSDIVIDKKILFQQLGIPMEMEENVFENALSYFHSIGRIVVLTNGFIFTKPTSVSQITAKFISPDSM